MAVRFYLVPVESAVGTRGPKYFAYTGDPDPPALLPGVQWQMMDFGSEPTALVGAEVTPAEHTTLSGQSDVTSIPPLLDNELGANLATVQGKLEALNLPADQVMSTHTYRQVLRGVIAIFLVAQRFYSLGVSQPDGGRLFPPGITLATTLGQLSSNARIDLSTAASQLGYDYRGLVLSSTLRTVLKKLATQSVAAQFVGVTV